LLPAVLLIAAPAHAGPTGQAATPAAQPAATGAATAPATPTVLTGPTPNMGPSILAIPTALPTTARPTAFVEGPAGPEATQQPAGNEQEGGDEYSATGALISGLGVLVLTVAGWLLLRGRT
jgi:hypothetical protein